MKKGIHPTINKIEVKCSTCENTHTLETTAKNVSIDVCSKCHAFYTGNSSAIKSTGRVERFNRMFGKQASNNKK